MEAIPPTLTVVAGTAAGEEPAAGAATPASGAGAPPTAAAAEPRAVTAEPSPPQAPAERFLSEEAGAAGAPARAVPVVEAGGNPRGSHRSGDPDWHGEPFSNATHRSTTDPEARL